VPARKSDEVKIIQIAREEALDFIHHECQNNIGNIFNKLRYDGETLFLVANESTNLVSNIVDRKIQRKKLMKNIDQDLEIKQ
jgi:hypothetical protein